MSHERRKTWQDRVININIANEAASLINSTKLSDLLSINSITATQFWPICQPWSQHTHHTFTMTATLFKYRIIIKTAKLMYHIFRSQCPPYLIDLISFLPKHHQQFRLQSSLARAAVTQQTRISSEGERFCVCGPKIWNSLPLDIPTIDSHWPLTPMITQITFILWRFSFFQMTVNLKSWGLMILRTCKRFGCTQCCCSVVLNVLLRKIFKRLQHNPCVSMVLCNLYTFFIPPADVEMHDCYAYL